MMETRETKKYLYVFLESDVSSLYGIGTYVRQLLPCFDPIEWNLNVVTLHTQKREIEFRVDENGVNYYNFPMLPKNVSRINPSQNGIYAKSVFYYLVSRMGAAPKIYCQFNLPKHQQLAVLFKKELQATIVFTAHLTKWALYGLDVPETKRFFADCNETVMEQTVKREKAFMNECCDRVITVAHHVYHQLHQYHQIPLDKLVCIPHALPDTYQSRTQEERLNLKAKYGFTEAEKIILYVGRLHPEKGPIELIQAFKSVLTEMPHCRLVLAGAENFSSCMKAAAPCWKQVIFTGFIPQEQLADLYAIADVGVVPSYYEEFGYSAAEMMMNALPIVVNCTSGLKELVADEHYGATFSLEDGEKQTNLKNTLMKILSQKRVPNLRAREHMLQHYSFDEFKEKVKTVFN